MARLFANDSTEFVFAGATAKFTVDPEIPMGTIPKTEIWERVLSFTSGAMPPPYQRIGVFDQPTSLSGPQPPLSLNPGDIYQVRLFLEGQGNADGESSSVGTLLGKLDFPVLIREGRTDFLTQCAEVPQIDITMGGTFASIAYAGSTPTRARIQLGVGGPKLFSSGGYTGFPFFELESVVASSVTDSPKYLNKASLVDTRMTPDQSLFFVIFAWNQSGNWDMIWNTTGKVPNTNPELIKTLKRVVNVRLDKLTCLDDSDDFSSGEATFTFMVYPSNNPIPITKTINWDPMETETPKLIRPLGTATIQLDPPDANGRVGIRIEGKEDDSGFPPDDDDLAAVGDLVGKVALFFPVGESKEKVDEKKVVYDSERLTFSELLKFSAEVIYSVNYIP